MAYSNIDDAFLGRMAELQFPTMPVEEPMQEEKPVLLAAGKSETASDVMPANATTLSAFKPQDTIKPVDPTVRQQLSDFLQAGFEKFGMDRYRARKQAQTLMGGESSNLPISLGLADIVPFLGTALQTQEAFRMGEDAVTSAQQGNYGTAALQTGGAALGLLPGGAATAKAAKATGKALAPKAGEMLSDYMRRSGMQLDLMAYHGTPHQFDKFDSSKIGTGEGAQAYGYGLYFAENNGVAGGYAVNLANRDAANQGRLNAHANAQRLANLAGDPKAAAEDIRFALEADPSNPQKQLLSDTLKFLESGDYKKPLSNAGVVYTVDIPDSTVAKMLDFDAPLRQQSPEIRALAQKYNLSMDDLGGDLLAAAEGKTAKGAQIMRDAGVPGVRYLDQGSRGDGNGTRNIVVFPGGENQIKIIKTEGAK